MSSSSPSPEAVAWLASAAHSVGDDPFGIAAKLEAYVAGGCRGSLERALTSSRDDAREQRDALLRELYARFEHVPKRSRREAAAYKALSDYWDRRWRDGRARTSEDCPHDSNSVDYLCWNTFFLIPSLIGPKQFINIIRHRIGNRPL